MSKINIIGAGGHSRSVIALLMQNNISINGIYDDHFKDGEKILNVPLLGTIDSITANNSSEKIILAVGDNELRKTLFLRFKAKLHEKNIFHPTACVEHFTELGLSNAIFAQVYINNEVKIGDNNLINTRAILEHEVQVGSHNHISINAALLGRSAIGDNCFIGAGAIIRDRVKICSNVIVGANSYVAEDITVPGTYVGSPARRIG